MDFIPRVITISVKVLTNFYSEERYYRRLAKCSQRDIKLLVNSVNCQCFCVKIARYSRKLEKLKSLDFK